MCIASAHSSSSVTFNNKTISGAVDYTKVGFTLGLILCCVLVLFMVRASTFVFPVATTHGHTGILWMGSFFDDGL